MIVKKEKVDDILKTQMQTISNLQEKIKLQKFEISKLNDDKKLLKKKLSYKNKIIENVKIEIINIYKNDKKAELILKLLDGGANE